jgi:2-keto-4-pentenoate hydratase
MSTLDSTVLTDLADALWRAEADRVAIEPLTAAGTGLTVDDAYAIQTTNVDRRLASGAVVRGHKVGLTSRPVQDLLGVHEPNFGVLLDDMFVDEGDEVPFDSLVQPRVESEIAFLMGSDLAGPGVTTTDALAAVAGVLPAIEIVDSRIADWRIRIVDTVADNASSARAVLGARMTPVTAVDLRLLGVLFSRNGVPLESGAGAAVLGNPAHCIAWLANKLGSFGSGLRRNDVVLSGALHRMVPVRPGDFFQAQFAHLGDVAVQFSGGRFSDGQSSGWQSSGGTP